MRAPGLDTMNANHGLVGVDLRVVPLESEDWRGLTPAGLRSKLDRLQLPAATAPSGIPQERCRLASRPVKERSAFSKSRYEGMLPGDKTDRHFRAQYLDILYHPGHGLSLG